MDNVKICLFAATITVLLSIGFFSGAIFEQQKRIKQEKKFVQLFKKVTPTIRFWEEGYMRRDTALTRISNHKDCTDELRSIIGDIY